MNEQSSILRRWLSGENQDSALAAFAGELLGLAGPVDSSAIAFKPTCAPHTPQLTPNQQPATEQDTARGTNLSTMMVAALQLMANYLDSDVVVIKSVQFTLRNLLATQLGRDAFAQLDDVTQGYLQVGAPFIQVAASSFLTVAYLGSDARGYIHASNSILCAAAVADWRPEHAVASKSYSPRSQALLLS